MMCCESKMCPKTNLNHILPSALKRMHRYSCAEASLQALMDLWDLPKDGFSWATGGYLGAIMSGQATCGLLIGSSIAISFRGGKGLPGIPEEYEPQRNRVIQAVNELYLSVIEKFGSSDCYKLNQIDFTNPQKVAEWTMKEGWKKTCDVYLDFVLKKCLQMAEQGKI